MDDADDLDLDLALLLLENLTFRDEGKILIVAAVDPDGPLATALRKGERAWLAGRVFVVDVDPDMGPQSRMALARELRPGLDDVLARRIGQRTATLKDVLDVADTTERAAELSAAGDEVGALTAIDAVIDAVIRGPDPSPAAVMVAWAGGVVHARQVARVLADAGQAGLAADPDLAPSGEGHGPVIRLADPASPRFAAALARLQPQVRREMAAAVLQEAVTICADSAEPLVSRIVAGRAVHHVRRDLDGDTVSHLLRVQRGLVADLPADECADARRAAGCQLGCAASWASPPVSRRRPGHRPPGLPPGRVAVGVGADQRGAGCRDPPWADGLWGDVLVDVEEVAGIVGPLDLNQPVVVLPVVVPDLVVIVILHEVDVAARLCVRRKRLVIISHPLDPLGVLGGVGPGGEED